MMEKQLVILNPDNINRIFDDDDDMNRPFNIVSVKMEEDMSSVAQNNKPDSIKVIYKCCQLTFDDKFVHFDHMIDHMKEEMGFEKCLYKCYFCIRIFKTYNGMRSHIKAKHTDKHTDSHTVHKCLFCESNYASKNILLNHMIKKHNYEPNNNELKKWQKWKGISRYRSCRNYVHRSKQNRIKTERQLSDDKAEPILSNVKTEPIFANVKMEPIYTNVKIEPTINIKIEPQF